MAITDSRTARAHATLIAIRRGLALLALFGAVAPSAASAADVAHGEKVYKTCGICHSLDKNAQGPKHAGLFGRTAGTVPDFNYSPALKKSGIVWNEQTLDTWLKDPQAMVPGSKMFFAVDKDQDRADVIEFLKQKVGSTTAAAGAPKSTP